MKYEYSENVLVQDSAAALMHDELGWDVIFAYNQERFCHTYLRHRCFRSTKRSIS